jgi:hypothetical protein
MLPLLRHMRDSCDVNQGSLELRNGQDPALLLANVGVINGTRDAAPAAWKRFVALVLQACRAERATSLPPPPTHTEMYQAMNRLDRT